MAYYKAHCAMQETFRATGDHSGDLPGTQPVPPHNQAYATSDGQLEGRGTNRKGLILNDGGVLFRGLRNTGGLPMRRHSLGFLAARINKGVQ